MTAERESRPAQLNLHKTMGQGIATLFITANYELTIVLYTLTFRRKEVQR